MENYRLYIPEGVRDYLATRALLKYTMEQQCISKFLNYGYEYIETPTFEYIDVFSEEERLCQDKSLYKWVNRQGEIVALKSDMTKSIARVVATEKSKAVLPQRYAYMANSFRNFEKYQGRNHEFTQGGVEIIGTNSLESDAEVIHLAIETLKATGLKDFVIHIGSSVFLKALLTESSLNEVGKQEIYKALQKKDIVSVKNILSNYQMTSNNIEKILDSMQCIGEIEILLKLKEDIISQDAKKALEDLEVLYSLLKEYQDTDYILFDLSLVSYASYYTGIMFQAFALDIGEAIAEGGRYDQLLSRFGKDLPAVGFGINMNLLIQGVEQGKSFKPLNPKKLLFVFNDKTRKEAVKQASSFREKNIIVENWIDKNLESALAYAIKNKIEEVLYFKESEQIIIYNTEEQTKWQQGIDL